MAQEDLIKQFIMVVELLLVEELEICQVELELASFILEPLDKESEVSILEWVALEVNILAVLGLVNILEELELDNILEELELDNILEA